MAGVKAIAQATLARARRTAHPSGAVAALMRTEPISRTFGLERGTAVDRFYIERFLAAKSALIRGRVLEIGDPSYTRRFGSGVEHSDVLHATGEGGEATIVGDLATGNGVPHEAYDCIILTQTLPFILDVRDAVANTHSALKPGGWVLATVPGISQISRYDMDRWGDFWRFTDASARALFDGFGQVEIQTYGNVGAACALLQGLAAEELSADVLEARDRDYQLVITIAARRV